MLKKLKYLILLVSVLGVVFIFRDPIIDVWTQLKTSTFPCNQPISYSIGSFDTKFGITQNSFLNSIKTAEQTWEKAINKDLFSYDPNDGDLKINLIYDYRQEATIKLQRLGITLEDNKATYESLKIKYDTLKISYKRDEEAYRSRLAAFEKRRNTYEAEVTYWNARKGAPKDIYAQLTSEKEWLDAETIQINRIQTDINTKIDTLNALVVTLNRLIIVLNLNVDRFNAIGEERGEEFSEGLYRSRLGEQEIDIYQFDNEDKLIRVLMHEMGHALGLGHVENPQAIMYRLNQGENSKLAIDDINALKEICKQ